LEERMGQMNRMGMDLWIEADTGGDMNRDKKPTCFPELSVKKISIKKS
jgi:hypothetical protein